VLSTTGCLIVRHFGSSSLPHQTFDPSDSALRKGSLDGAPPGFPGRRASHLGNIQTALLGRITPATTHVSGPLCDQQLPAGFDSVQTYRHGGLSRQSRLSTRARTPCRPTAMSAYPARVDGRPCIHLPCRRILRGHSRHRSCDRTQPKFRSRVQRGRVCFKFSEPTRFGDRSAATGDAA
jgi:hypothetical protein